MQAANLEAARKWTNEITNLNGEKRVIFGTITEKRKSAGFSLKNQTEYTKINRRIQPGVQPSFVFTTQHGLRRFSPKRGRGCPGGRRKTGQAQGPALAPPFGFPKGSTLHR
ncbi:MAG: hypothetical protein HFF26_00665 [Oscillospiraceae bacterium]|nr:hypothetical protein [Oscillospiraceae bacterium]